ncbi:hypothetical protein AAG906_025824 [Vitis piasezkii]
MDVSLESKSLPSVGYSRKSYLQTTSQRLARDKLVHLYGWRSLALSSVGPGDLKARTSRHCAKWLRNSPGKRYKRIRICVTGKLKRSPLPSGVRILDVKHPGGMWRQQNSGSGSHTPCILDLLMAKDFKASTLHLFDHQSNPRLRRVLWNPTKDVRTGRPDTPSEGGET